MKGLKEVMRSQNWLCAIPFLVTIALWWGASQFGNVAAVSLPSPQSVISALSDLWEGDQLQKNILVSLGRVTLAAAVSVPLGVGLGLLMGLSRTASNLVLPLATFFNSVSGIAWLPLAITWFGLGTGSMIFIIWNSIFFLVFFNTVLGVRSVPMIYEQAVRTLGGRYRVLITDVFFPGALPHIMTGVRSGFAFGWRALIAGEMIAATNGLGFLIFDSANFLRSDRVLGGVLVIGAVWFFMDNMILRPLERRTIERWGTVTTP